MVWELNLLLYQSLTERTAADDGGTVVVLHGSCKDLSRRSRTLIDEHNHRNLLVGTLAITHVILARRLAALGIEYEFLLRQELVCHVHSGCEITTRIVAQVDTEILESLL